MVIVTTVEICTICTIDVLTMNQATLVTKSLVIKEGRSKLQEYIVGITLLSIDEQTSSLVLQSVRNCRLV